MKKLIINADDFGLHRTVNEAVIVGYKNGCLTSTSIIPSGKAFDEAVQLAVKNPGLGIGVHLTLVAEAPVCDPDSIPSLVSKDGLFHRHYPQFFVKYFLGKINLDEVRRELMAQVDKVIKTGLPITHIDSHQHLHIIPGILDIVIDIAKTYRIRAVRIPDEPYFFIGGYPFSFFRIVARAGLTFLARLARVKVKKNGLAVPGHFFGMLAGGNLQEKYLYNIINQMPEGVSEIMMHPAVDSKVLQNIYKWHYNWENELKALTSNNIAKLIESKKIRLVSFGELTNG